MTSLFLRAVASLRSAAQSAAAQAAQPTPVPAAPVVWDKRNEEELKRIRDMWDRLTAPTPTVTPESTFRQPIRRFTVSRPPRSACRFTCVSALYWLCVSSFPVGFSEDRVLRSGLASEALRVVLRGFVVLPLLTQGQLYAVYLFFTTGGGGSVSLITRAPAPTGEALLDRGPRAAGARARSPRARAGGLRCIAAGPALS